MAGFREFLTGEVLTAANVDDFLAKQAVMKFADAAARDSALGTAVAGGNALREGMVAWLDDEDSVIAYDGTAWNPVGGASGGFQYAGSVYFTANGSFAKSDPFGSGDIGLSAIRVRCVGGGGGGAGGGFPRRYGAGGGGGGYSETFITDIAGLATAVTVTRGAGGAGSFDQATGTAGGNSTFGADGATGGAGGAGNGGAGGTSTGTVDFVAAGGSGGGGGHNNPPTGAGGSSHLGGGASGRDVNAANGFAGGLHGGGGGGGGTPGGAAQSGGAGANGIVIVDCFV